MSSSEEKDTKSNKQALLKTKCSPKRVVKVMEVIKENEVLTRVIDEMGFKSLTYLHPIKMEYDLIKNLLDNFDVNKCSVSGVIIEAADVGRILGVPAEGKLIPSISDEEQAKSKSKFEKRSLKLLTSDLENSKNLIEADISFKETFMLFILGHFLCPTTRELPSVNTYKAMSILSDSRDYNWAQFILQFLLDSIKDYQRRTTRAENGRNIGIGGCIFFLEIFSLQRMNPLFVESGMPIFSAWTQQEIKLALKKNSNLKKEARFTEPLDRIPDRLVPCDRMVDRLVDLEQAVFNIDPSASRLNSTETYKERMRRLEDVVFGPRSNIDYDDSMEKHVKASFEHASFVHAASARREDIQPLVEEELKRYTADPASKPKRKPKRKAVTSSTHSPLGIESSRTSQSPPEIFKNFRDTPSRSLEFPEDGEADAKKLQNDREADAKEFPKSSGQCINTPCTLRASPSTSHQTPRSISNETAGFFKHLEQMLQGDKFDQILPPQIQLDEQTIYGYEQVLKKGLSGNLKDLKDARYQEFNEALNGLLACRRIPSHLHQRFLSLRQELPSLAGRALELNKEVTQGMLHRSTMKELESYVHRYRNCEDQLVKLEREKESNLSEISKLRDKNAVIDSEIMKLSAEANALQKTSAAQIHKITSLEVVGAPDETSLRQSIDGLQKIEDEWKKCVSALNF